MIGREKADAVLRSDFEVSSGSDPGNMTAELDTEFPLVGRTLVRKGAHLATARIPRDDSDYQVALVMVNPGFLSAEPFAAHGLFQLIPPDVARRIGNDLIKLADEVETDPHGDGDA